jgi:hypothetical protein
MLRMFLDDTLHDERFYFHPGVDFFSRQYNFTAILQRNKNDAVSSRLKNISNDELKKNVFKIARSIIYKISILLYVYIYSATLAIWQSIDSRPFLV